MDAMAEADVLAHYVAVAPTVLRHVRGRTVHHAGWSASGTSTVESESALRTVVGSGGRWLSFAVHELDGWSVLRLTPGPGADTATTATTALTLSESAASRGTATVVMSDGESGMYILFADPDAAGACLADLVDRAPEIATADPDADDGRVLLTPLAADRLLPAPYSLVDTADGTGVVLPLHLDEIAAAAAGMPLEPQPTDAAARLADRGDLAAVLVRNQPPPA